MSRRPLFEDAGEDESAVPRRAIPQADLDITPMIDVTFLLLIFFMVTSTMQGAPDVEVPPAKHGVGVDANAATVVTVKRPEAAGESPTIVLGDGRGEVGDLDGVRAYVERGRDAGIAQVIVKADRDVPHGFVQEVVKAVNSVERVTFSIGDATALSPTSLSSDS